MTWDLSKGARVRVTQGPGKGFEGIVQGQDAEGHYLIDFPVMREGRYRNADTFFFVFAMDALAFVA